MTTYCLNTLTICTDEVTDGIPANLYENLGDFAFPNKRWIDFNILSTPPENVNDLHEWCIENWGTEGLSGSKKIEETLEDVFCIELETYETPPIPWVRKASSLYPELIFDLNYLNVGKNFTGGYSFIAGVEVVGVHSEINLASWEKFGYLESDFVSFSKHIKRTGNA